MLNENQVGKQDANLLTKQPELVSALHYFKEQNDSTEELLLLTKERLNRIIIWNGVSQEECANKILQPIVNSAMDEFNFQLKRQREFNERLNDILQHLNEVI